MTICIGAICNKGHTVVVATDRMVTTQLPPIEFEHPGSKIDTLTDKSVLLVAGHVLPGTEVLKRAKVKLSSSGITDVEEITKVVCGFYREYRQEQVEERWLKPRGLNLDLFYKEGKCQAIPKDLALIMDREMIKFNLGVDLIVAGVDDAGGHIYTISNPGSSNCHDKIGYVSIGSGAMHAISTFIFNNFSVDFGINEGVYYTFEAKTNSENAPGVGSETSMAIITSEAIKFLTRKDIDFLTATCGKITRPRIAQEKKSIKGLPFEEGTENEKTSGS